MTNPTPGAEPTPRRRPGQSRTAVLAALTARPGVKLSVREVAQAAGLTQGAARTALQQLRADGLIQHATQHHAVDRPPHAVYWATRAALRPRAGGRQLPTPRRHRTST